MTLNRKTLLILATASAVSILLSYMVLRATVYATFIELENDSAVNNTNRAEAAVQSQLDNLAVLNVEYSMWDDTYEFLQDRNEDYISKNVNAETLEMLDLDFVTLLDAQGQLVFGIERDSDNIAVVQAIHPFAVRDPIRDRISVSKSATDNLVGVINGDLGPLLIASFPVLQSDGQGPPAGSLIFGRVLTEARVKRLRAQLSIEFEFVPATSKQLTSNLRRAL
jgi:sensor domain CHASE-containing protein